MKKAKSIHPSGKWFRFSGQASCFPLYSWFILYYIPSIFPHIIIRAWTVPLSVWGICPSDEGHHILAGIAHFLFSSIQVPIMLILCLLFANLLNSKEIRFKGFFRLALFLPCH